MFKIRINDWEEFINDDKYKKYLLNNDEKWLNKFQGIKRILLMNIKELHYKKV